MRGLPSLLLLPMLMAGCTPVKDGEAVDPAVVSSEEGGVALMAEVDPDAISIVENSGLESPYACSLGVNAAPDIWDVPPDERVLRNELGQLGASEWIKAVKKSRFASDYTVMWIDHEPCFRVVGNFTDVTEADAIIALAPERLQPYLDVQLSRLNAAGWDAKQDYLIALLKSVPIGWTSGYNVEHDIIDVTVPADWKERVEAMIAPDRRAYFDVATGAVPVIQPRLPADASPSTVQ